MHPVELFTVKLAHPFVCSHFFKRFPIGKVAQIDRDETKTGHIDQGEARVIEPAVASLLRPTESHPLGQVAPDQPGAPIDGRGFQEEAAALQEKPSARSREYGLEPGPTFPPRGLQNRQPIEVGSSAVLDAQVGVEQVGMVTQPESA